MLRSQIMSARYFQRQARIKRSRVEEKARALTAALAERRRQRKQPCPQLPYFVPLITQRRYSFLPSSVSRSPEPIVHPAIPQVRPESEDDDFIPSLSDPDCKIIDKVGSSTEEEAPPPLPVVTRSLVRVVRI